METQSAADDVIGMGEDFSALLCKVAELEAVEAPSPPDELAWAESLEGAVTEAAEAMADEAENVRRGVAVLALRPGEAATVAALRMLAALTDARRAEAEEVAAAARRLQEKNLWSLAAREDDPDDLSWLLGGVAGRGTMGPSVREGAGLAALAPEGGSPSWTAGALVRADGREDGLAGRQPQARRVGVRGEARRRRGGGARRLVGALRRQAASVDAARAVVEAFTGSVRRLRDREMQGTAGRT